MKRNYVTPTANKVAFSYQEHVVAEGSFPISNYADPWHADKCTWGGGGCSAIYNVKARGTDDCQIQGN